MSIFFIRHGRTASSGTGRLGSDEELTEAGREDSRVLAVELRKLLEGESLDHIISSPRLRALQTARVVASSLGYSPAIVRVDDRIAERNVEPYIGQLISEVFQQSEATLIAGGMEPLKELQERTTEAAQEIRQLVGNVLLVGHSGNIALLCKAFGAEPNNDASVLRLR